MIQFFKEKTTYFLMFLTASAMISIAGCDDSGTITPTDQANPNVKSFDSLYIEEDSALSTFAGLSLFGGFNTTSTSSSRDVGLGGGLDSLGRDFFLRSGLLLNNPLLQVMKQGFTGSIPT